MTLQETIKTLQNIALTQPNVRTIGEGNIYDFMNGNSAVRYGVFFVSQNTHQSYSDRDLYGFNLFYIDRNEDDNNNTLQVQSIGKTVIDNIIKVFCEEFDCDMPVINYTPFTQRFIDDTSGVFAGITIEVYKVWECAEQYGEYITDRVIVRNQDKTIKVTESGVYVVTPDDGFTGLGKVVVDAELANTVQDLKTLEVNDNGNYKIVADEPYLSMKEVEVSFEYNPKTKLPNGICLSGSTWEEFDMTQYDWSMVYDYSFMFNYCDTKTKKIIACGKPLIMNSMFEQPSFINYINDIDVTELDTSECINMSHCFQYISQCTEIKGIEDWDVSNVTNMSYMFFVCSSLTSLDLSKWDVSKVTSMERMFDSCYNLQTLTMGGSIESLESINMLFNGIKTDGTFYYPKEYDYSKIIAVLPTTWTAVAY